MVHTRLNERTVNPNSHINFISALPPPGSYGAPEDVEAQELLRTLAAQLKPVMKSHGFTVNSFEEVWRLGRILYQLMRHTIVRE